MCGMLAVAQPIAGLVKGAERIEGFLPLYWDAKKGNLYMEISRWDEEFLFYTSLPAGLGSNDVGLDRGQVGDSRIVRFERTGGKVLLTERNRLYRSSSSDPAEQRAVDDSFASAVHWGFKIEAEEGDRVLIDLTPFVLRDGHGAADRIKSASSGSYRLDASRSVVYRERTRAFPRNTEIEVRLTFTGDPQGPHVPSVAADASALTLREHYSFVALPGPGYTPKAFDPRSGFFSLDYADYSVPLGEPMARRLIVRHRLTRTSGPIRYYLDPGTPEPIRTALLDGARWWAGAFAAAGFPNAFTVEMLPPGADPMDVRYNMIHWVHRSTRGWSYGASIVDPRTGEILKGNVTLGSLRVRQDYLIAEGLLAPYETGRPAPPAMREMALARLRQLSAHEVGHTLGLAHNFAASISNRASVMDYPHPLVTLAAEGAVSLKDAYPEGIGEWDKVAITWGYGEPSTDILADARRRGLRFLSDSDARPPGGASPVAHLWDNGADPLDELQRLLAVRRRALDRFGERNIPEGRPYSTLADTLVPVYLLHRYQVEAAAKVLGGIDYNYALRGDGQKVAEPVPAAAQRRALDLLLRTIAPEELDLPEKLLRLLPPRAYGYERTREQFASRTGLTFDPVGAAESAAGHTIGMLLNPERASRLQELHARDAAQPGLRTVVDRLVTATWVAPLPPGLRGEIQRATRMVVLHHLMLLAANERAAASARAAAFDGLQAIRKLEPFAASLIERFQRDGKTPAAPKPLEPPPGQPIGCASLD